MIGQIARWIWRPVRDFLFHGGVALACGTRDCLVHYYVEKRNFGDLLNVDLFRHFGLRIRYAAQTYAQAVAIGSFLQRLRPMVGSIASKRPVHVLGTGFIMPMEIDRFFRPVVIHALRGRLSLAHCERILGRRLPDVVLGDPGLLIRRIFPEALKAKKRFDVALICHMKDINSPHLRNVRLSKLTCRTIDMTQDSRTVVMQIAECRFVLSSAMHGLICADSLGIPNRRMILGDQVEGGDFKFEDYYSAYSTVPRHDPVDLRTTAVQDEDILSLSQEYAIDASEVERICNCLEAEFKRYAMLVQKTDRVEVRT